MSSFLTCCLESFYVIFILCFGTSFSMSALKKQFSDWNHWPKKAWVHVYFSFTVQKTTIAYTQIYLSRTAPLIILKYKHILYAIWKSELGNEFKHIFVVFIVSSYRRFLLLLFVVHCFSPL